MPTLRSANIRNVAAPGDIEPPLSAAMRGLAGTGSTRATYDTIDAMLTDEAARSEGDVLVVRDVGPFTVGPVGGAEGAYTSALERPLYTRIGSAGSATMEQIGCRPGSSYNVTARLQQALYDMGDRKTGGEIVVPPDIFYAEGVIIPPKVRLRGTTKPIFMEGTYDIGPVIRQIDGQMTPLVYNDPDNAGSYLRAAASESNEGNQYYYNSAINDVVLDCRKTGGIDSRADALRLERAWNMNLDGVVCVSNKRSMAMRIIDCNVQYASDFAAMGTMFLYSVADSIYRGGMISSMGSAATPAIFWPSLWLAGSSCWKNLLIGNLPFNNTANHGGLTWGVSSISGETLTLSATHYYNNGDPICVETDGTLPAPLSWGGVYFVKRISATEIKLATMLKYVAAGPYVTPSGGSGTMTVRGGPNTNMALVGASRNSITGQRYDQAYGSGIILRGATRNTILGGAVMENGKGNASPQKGVSLEHSSTGNTIKGLIIDGSRFSGDENQTVGISRDATSMDNDIDVVSTGHSDANYYPTPEEHLEFWPADMRGVEGSPAVGLFGGNRHSGWLLDGAASESVEVRLTIPDGWTKAALSIIWANAGAGTGNVVFAWNGRQFVDGNTYNVVDDLNSAGEVFTAAAQDVRVTSVHPTVFGVVAGRETHFRIKRAGGDALDTLANDIVLIGVVLTKTA